jgi:zinc protease
MASTPQNYFQQEFYTYLNKENPRFNGVMPTDKSWADTDYKLAYENTKSVLQMRQILNFFFVGNVDDATIGAYAAKYLASLPTTDRKTVDLGYRMLKAT